MQACTSEDMFRASQPSKSLQVVCHSQHVPESPRAGVNSDRTRPYRTFSSIVACAGGQAGQQDEAPVLRMHMFTSPSALHQVLWALHLERAAKLTVGQRSTARTRREHRPARLQLPHTFNYRRCKENMGEAPTRSQTGEPKSRVETDSNDRASHVS